MGALRALIARQAARAPSAPAIGAPGRAWLDFTSLLAQVDAIGARLRASGVGPGDRVAIVLPNGPEMATAFLGVASYAAAAPLNPVYRGPEFSFFLEDLAPRALVALAGQDSPCRAVAAALGIAVLDVAPLAGEAAGRFTLDGPPAGEPSSAAPCGGEDVALVLHTSGTTARPKIVPLSHENLCASADHIGATLALGPADRALNVMPLYHIHGLIAATLSSLAAGASMSATPGFDASAFFRWYEEVRPTWYTAVPTMHQAVLAAAGAHAALLRAHPLRFARSSSAAMPAPVMAELERVLGAPLLEAYGMTEASHQMTSNPLPPHTRKPGTVGLPTGIELTILDAEGRELAPGERGEVSIRGPNVTRGYHNNPSANAACFTRGWFRTGDQGFLDADGYLTLSARIKEIINKAGEKIGPREIDDVLMLHPGVHQVVTFALPHPTLGEDVGAAVVLKDGASIDEATLRQFCATRLADFKVPQRILIVAEVPKGPTGKLKRIGLAEHFAAELAAPPYVAPRTDLERRLAAVWAEELGIAKVGVDDNYFVLGGDSLQAVMLAARAKRSGIAISPHQLFESPTVAGLAAALKNEGATRADEARGAAALELDRSDAAEHLVVAAAALAGRARDDVVDAYPTLPFQQNIVARYEPRLTPSAFVTRWTLHGRLDAERLQAALDHVVETFPALRTGFVKRDDGEVIQFVVPRATAKIECHDLQAAETLTSERAIEAALRAPFDLTRPPLARVLLLREADDRHVLACVWFHAVVDLWSVGILERALLAAYDARGAGALAEGAPPAASFADYVRDALGRTSETQQEAFFRAELAGLTEAKLLRFFRGPGGFRLPSGERGVVSRRFEGDAWTAVGAWSRRHALTPSTALHGIWALVQAHYLEIDDVLFGSLVSGRWGALDGIGGIVGPTVEVVPLRVRVDPSARLVPWLAHLQTRLADLQRVAHTPWDRVARVFDPPRRNVPAWSTLVVENLPSALWERPSSSLRCDGFAHRAHMLPPLLLSLFPVPEPHLKATFDPSFFAAEDVSLLLEGVTRALAALVASDGTVGSLGDVLDPAARRWRAG